MIERNRQDHADFSTINREEQLPVHTLPGSRMYQQSSGNGCAGDPPGYPSYFTRAVYTARGDNPSRGTTMTLSVEGIEYVIEKASDEYTQREEVLRRLWKALTIDHPRTIAWIQVEFIHHHHCYQDLTIPNRRWSERGFVYPVPDYKLRSFHDDERFSDEWREKAQAEVAQANKEIRERAEKLATWDNHAAVIIIQSFYPEWDVPESERAQYLEPTFARPGNWWEALAEQPTPEECPGQFSSAHPVNGTWCQMCGWHE